jgi:hypothetical protein
MHKGSAALLKGLRSGEVSKIIDKAEEEAKAAGGAEDGDDKTADKEAPAEAADAAEDKGPRVRLDGGRVTGLLYELRANFGWIQPFTKIQHEHAKKHRGMIYLALKDVVAIEGADHLKVKEGKIVDFFVYVDNDGLGAEECRPRQALRMSLAHSQANATFKDSPQWSEFLANSEYYPAFESETGVLLRKYAWPLPFALVELWGHPAELAAAAVKLVSKAATPKDGEKKDGEEPEPCELRLLLPEGDLAKVESLPANPKVSGAPVMSRPLPCRSLTLTGPAATCEEGVKEFLKVMSAPPAGDPPAGDGAA